MYQSHSNRNIWLSTATVLLVATVVFVADSQDKLTSVRMSLHNALSPGRLVLMSVAAPSTNAEGDSSSGGDDTTPEVAELQDSLLQNELQRRQLLIENARLNNEVRQMRRQGAIRTVAGRDLINFIGLKAKVLSRRGLPNDLKEALIDAGRDQGLRRSELVVSGDGFVVDKGTDHGLTVGQQVADGAAVVGRIAKLSQWVGLVQPVTNAEFSGAVQIVKMQGQGATFGAQGLLEGTGESLCRVTGIPYTEAVTIGDYVFSASVQGINGPRLFYGEVVHAEFSAGGQWDIRVQPAFESEQMDEVVVVKQRLDSQRTTQAKPGASTIAGGDR